jgi:DNA uptake protein ComE-like DNA-binding protein
MMTRSLPKPSLLLALLLAAAPAWGAQDPKPTPTEPVPVEAMPAKPATAPKVTKPAAKVAKAAPKTKKEAAAPAKPSKATGRKPAHAPNYMLGETPPPKNSAKAPASPKFKPRQKTAKNPTGKWVDVNTATKEELKQLPGIFDAEADKIIAKRPYKSKAGLLVDAGLTGAQYFGIKDRVIAGQALPK